MDRFRSRGGGVVGEESGGRPPLSPVQRSLGFESALRPMREEWAKRHKIGNSIASSRRIVFRIKWSGCGTPVVQGSGGSRTYAVIETEYRIVANRICRNSGGRV